MIERLFSEYRLFQHPSEIPDTLKLWTTQDRLLDKNSMRKADLRPFWSALRMPYTYKTQV